MSETAEWRNMLLKDVCEFTRKPRSLRPLDFPQIPFVPMELIPERVMYSDKFLLKEPGLLGSGTYFERGDILLAKITPCFENGKQTILLNLPQPFGFATTEVIPLRERPGISDKAFLFFYLLRPEVRAQLASKMEGTTGRQRLNKATLEDLPIALPPLVEQRAMAHVLQVVQKAADVRQTEAVLERERRIVLRNCLLTKGTAREQTKSTSIGEIPQSWKVKTLRAVSDLYSGGTPSKSRPDWWKGSIPWVSTKDLKKPYLSDVTDHITEEAVQKGSRLVPAMSLFVGVRGMILAKEIPICLARVPMAFNQDIKAVVPHEGINPEFLLYALNFYKAALSPHVGTSAHGTRRISSEVVANLELPIPPDEEQSRIANILTACDRRIAALEQEHKLLVELFSSLLEDLMSGRINVTPAIENGACQ